MNQQGLSQWNIEARAFQIIYTPFTHNFWALTNANRTVIDQIHGLAVNPKTKAAKAIGTSSDLLQVIRDPTILWSLQQGQPIVTCATSCETQIKQRWQAAVNAIPAINALEIHYPNLWQHIYKKNSNTVLIQWVK